MSFKWTKQEEDILKKMIAAGKTPEDCARVLKSRTVDGIRNKAKRMVLKFKYEVEIDKAEFNKMMGK
jgi:hypothetical protein